MYKSFRVQNFRGFKDLQLNDLARVNLIAGRNNTGKTALLEALFMYSGGYVTSNVLRVQYLRGLDWNINQFTEDAPWKLLFYNLDKKSRIFMSGTHNHFGSYRMDISEIDTPEEKSKFTTFIDENAENFNLNISDPQLRILSLIYEKDGDDKTYYIVQERNGIQVQNAPPPIIEAFFLPVTGRSTLSDIAERYGELAKTRQHDMLIELTRIVEPRLKNLQVIPVRGLPMLYGDVGLAEDIPVASMGEGVNRLIDFILGISKVKGGIILIDEIENGLHYSVQTDVWRAIAKAAKLFNVQIFATTHSREMIEAAHKAFSETGEDDFRFYRLFRSQKKQMIDAVAYNPDNMEAALEMNLEMR